MGVAVFVFLLGQYVVGRAVCDLITDPDRFRRAVYFAVLPVVAIGLLVGANQIWDSMWSAVLIGLVGGWVTQQLIGGLLLPGIRAEERADDLEHVGEVLG